ncbi:hypothetical protein [Methylomonas albis]|uniref:Uncharacterized protein n=1 Tax=Methylomonas albis TaxID=1854563 RepID=A0ABR9D420_9GAMM|nr:hypothetical protein [Methylomonas albis]MBD9356964.1 hypothetical protein [Methylomonas albis]CAD6880154.1 hypothetical protein [Methylomonas albis]
MSTPATGKIRPIISYSDESVKLNAALSGINDIFHRLVEHSATDHSAPHNLFVCLESLAGDLINVCNTIDNSAGNPAASTRFIGKPRRIKSYGHAAVQLSKTISSLNGIFHLLIENSFKGIPAKFDLIVCLKTEAEQLAEVCQYMQETSDVSSYGMAGGAM